MDLKLHLPSGIRNAEIAITGSKSITNRLLLLQALFPGFEIGNSSGSDDSEVMLKALDGTDDVIDIHHAGTAMRFLTAYFSIQEGREVVLTGSQRMRERPIAVLVNALRNLGAQIEYLENEGFPPLKISGRKLTSSKVTIKADVSSQYITALLLIAGKLENGLELTLEGTITSRPYIEMTLSLLNEIGIETNFQDNKITVSQATQNPKPETRNFLTVESDWSSASYFYSITALSEEGTSIKLSFFKRDSLQGDSALVEIYDALGVSTKFDGDTITLRKENRQPTTINRQLNNTPDIAQTIAVTCFGLGIGCHLTGLHTLKIKETDRLSALKTELEKLGAEVKITEDSLILEPNNLFSVSVLRPGSLSFGEGRGEDLSGMSEAHSPLLSRGAGGEVQTYNDHRMALAFAPLAIKTGIIIKDAGVVSKSYPTFWDDLKTLGFEITQL
ncbi:3-phosphoshikimate 1-carboxyvinyltransferase [Flavobacterium album]|uniref:3-phosphoshikimate 1-carboxyvinyltransferase n=1 Tax=Flavobacterium album TaxID=2175091 RepID=A0A2S1QXF0_9FLAO|nr:3-phosphoshikimate 1-carboxyvinyltransferase [Flavobacterium album]AWH85019.1 3-phosphoshikimate 1-carboxyvinyltransferase [Flavobacterium album]